MKLLENRRHPSEQETVLLNAAKSLVIRVVGQFLSYPSSFFSNARTQQIVVMRWAIAAHLRRRFRLSFPAIAAAMGRPNHSSTITFVDEWDKLPDAHQFWADSMEEWRGYSKGRIEEIVAREFAAIGADQLMADLVIRGSEKHVERHRARYGGVIRASQEHGYFGA